MGTLVDGNGPMHLLLRCNLGPAVDGIKRSEMVQLQMKEFLDARAVFQTDAEGTGHYVIKEVSVPPF